MCHQDGEHPMGQQMPRLFGNLLQALTLRGDIGRHQA